MKLGKEAGNLVLNGVCGKGKDIFAYTPEFWDF